MMWWWWLVACQVPVGGDRHDLVGDRVAAIATHPEGDGVGASVALIVDGRPWADDAVDLGWKWVDATAAAVAAADAPFDATGPAPVLSGSGRLALVATFPSGFTERAYIDVSDPAVTGPALTGVALDAPGPVERDGAVTLTATLADDGDPRARWMSVDGEGTFTEQTQTTTRWDAAEIEVEDDEVVDRTPLPAGPVTILALVVDDVGGNAFVAREVDVIDASVGVWTTSGRLLPADAALSGLVRGTLVADDAAPSGLTLADVAPAGTLPDVDPYGTAALDCTGVSGPFDPSWLLDGRCLRSAVAGASVVVEAP